MCGLIGLSLLLASSMISCPSSCSCGCHDGGTCACVSTGAGSAPADEIETAMARAKTTGQNVVVTVAGMSADGIPDTAGAVRCAVKAVQQSDGPAVYVGRNDGHGHFEWWRYRPQPVTYYCVPPPPSMFFTPTFGGCGPGGCCGGGCCR